MTDQTRRVDRDEAEAIVLKRLHAAEEVDGIERAFAQEPDELPGHWVFFYQGRRYLEDGDITHALAGNGPIVIPKDGSEPFTLSAAEPIEPQLERLRSGGARRTQLPSTAASSSSGRSRV